MKPESLIFDVDGTLWNSVELVAKGWNLALEEAGLPPTCTPDNIRPLFGKTMDEIAAAIFPSLPQEERLKRMASCLNWEDRVMQADPCRIFYPQVRQTLTALAQHYRLFIASNCQRGYIELLLEKGDLRPALSGCSWRAMGLPTAYTLVTPRGTWKRLRAQDCPLSGQPMVSACRKPGTKKSTGFPTWLNCFCQHRNSIFNSYGPGGFARLQAQVECIAFPPAAASIMETFCLVDTSLPVIARSEATKKNLLQWFAAGSTFPEGAPAYTARSTLLERRHLVQTYTWRGLPSTIALTRLTLGFHIRLERL